MYYFSYLTHCQTGSPLGALIHIDQLELLPACSTAVKENSSALDQTTQSRVVGDAVTI